jgi:hypothetical protein
MAGLGKLGKFASGRLSELKLAGNSGGGSSFSEGPSASVLTPSHAPLSSSSHENHQQIAKDAKQLLENSVCTTVLPSKYIHVICFLCCERK